MSPTTSIPVFRVSADIAVIRHSSATLAEVSKYRAIGGRRLEQASPCSSRSLSRAQQRPRCFEQAHDFGRSIQTSKRRRFCPRPTRSAILAAARVPKHADQSIYRQGSELRRQATLSDRGSCRAIFGCVSSDSLRGAFTLETRLGLEDGRDLRRLENGRDRAWRHRGGRRIEPLLRCRSVDVRRLRRRRQRRRYSTV
jgi:hypothetical protein